MKIYRASIELEFYTMRLCIVDFDKIKINEKHEKHSVQNINKYHVTFSKEVFFLYKYIKQHTIIGMVSIRKMWMD